MDRPPTSPWSYDPDWGLLDPDADEILLGLLARDNEPPPVHEKPYRRWVFPPAYWPERGWFERRDHDWWEFKSYAAYEAEHKERWTRAKTEREARKAEQSGWYTSEAQEALRKYREAEAKKARDTRLREQGEQLAAVLSTITNAPPRRQLTPLPGPPVEKQYLMWGGWKIEAPQMIYGGWPAYWWSDRLRNPLR